jgi:Family of unknown function (DUF5946)
MTTCPECGATHPADQTCNDDFNQLLAWETEDADKWTVHHLMVLSYHVQHPTMYSQDGLNAAIKLLAEFLETNITPDEIRKRERARLNSNRRRFNITSRSGSYGAYKHPVHWPMTAATVVAGGPDNYVANVQAWATSIYDELKATENLDQGEQTTSPKPTGRPPGKPTSKPTGRPKGKSGQPLKPLGKHWKPRHKS